MIILCILGKMAAVLNMWFDVSEFLLINGIFWLNGISLTIIMGYIGNLPLYISGFSWLCVS